MRRREAVSSLRAHARPGQVLFICHGNLCRSPFAELVFRREMQHMQAGLFESVSAGFVGPNRRPPSEAFAAAGRCGIDLSGHRSRLVTFDLVHTSAIVVVMSMAQARAIGRLAGPVSPMIVVLGDLDPLPISTRTIRDPWSETAEVFDASYARIERCVRELASHLSAHT